jgi:hypothetical protein
VLFESLYSRTFATPNLERDREDAVRMLFYALMCQIRKISKKFFEILKKF